MGKLSFFNKIIWIANIVITAGLLLSYLAAHISPEIFWPIAFFGLAYPVLLGVNVLFCLYWLINFRKQFLLSFLMTAFGWAYLSHLIPINFSQEEKPSSAIKVLSFNSHTFGLYEWKDSANFKIRGKILEMLEREEPAILCIQEYYNNQSYFPITQPVKSSFRDVHFQEVLKKSGGEWGMATFSKYPIVDKGMIRFSKNHSNMCIYTDVLVAGDTIRIYNVHLESIRLKPEDYETVDQLRSGKYEKEEIRGSKKIVFRLKKAYIKRARQAEIVAHSIKNCPYPVILCGDFNDPPFSYTYQQFADHLNDAFEESGSGLGNTFIGNLPPIRIDYILYSDDFRAYDFKVVPDELSDHHPVSCFLEYLE